LYLSFLYERSYRPLADLFTDVLLKE